MTVRRAAQVCVRVKTATSSWSEWSPEVLLQPDAFTAAAPGHAAGGAAEGAAGHRAKCARLE